MLVDVERIAIGRQFASKICLDGGRNHGLLIF
jgi:hypothetical protein